MAKTTTYFLILLPVFITGCSSDKHAKDELACIEVSTTYPEKEIILTDIADVAYVHLNTEDDDYLYKDFVRCITENTFIVPDEVSGSILFFSRDGNPKSRFNHYGAGPQEYLAKGRNLKLFYNEFSDDVYVSRSNIIQVYSSTGEYRKTLKLPQGTQLKCMIDLDDESFFLYDDRISWNKNLYKRLGDNKYFVPQYDNDSSYFRISKTDGKVLDYLIFPTNDIDMIQPLNEGSIFHQHSTMEKCDAGVFICRCDLDTVFLYGKDKSLTPVFCKTPLVSDIGPMTILYEFVEISSYQFFCVRTTYERPPHWKDDYYFRNKQTGEIFRQKIILPDYKGKDFFINNILSFNEKEAVFPLLLHELKQAYHEDKLSGKLKELVATLNEYDDNDVFMLVNFK